MKFTFIRCICSLLILFFLILTEKRRDAPNGKLLMIIDNVLNYNLILVEICIFVNT